MPESLEAAAVLAFAIVPGYVLLVGYQYQRSYTAPERDLHVLAQAFVLSAFWLAVTWWPAGHLLFRWASRDALDDHELMVWVLCCLLLALAYGVGRFAGAAVRRVGARGEGWLFSWLRSLGLFGQPSLWDWIWTEAGQRENVLVVVRLKDGRSIEGLYAAASAADLSPKRPRVYLERSYGYDEEGSTVIYPRGAYIEGDQVVAVEFKS